VRNSGCHSEQSLRSEEATIEAIKSGMRVIGIYDPSPAAMQRWSDDARRRGQTIAQPILRAVEAGRDFSRRSE
jgi:hypothetical protein